MRRESLRTKREGERGLGREREKQGEGEREKADLQSMTSIDVQIDDQLALMINQC
jgi:hypothetical protein